MKTDSTSTSSPVTLAISAGTAPQLFAAETVTITKQELIELKCRAGYAESQLLHANKKIEERDKKIQELEGKVKDLKKRLFGKKSEKKGRSKSEKGDDLEGGDQSSGAKRKRGQQKGNPATDVQTTPLYR